MLEHSPFGFMVKGIMKVAESLGLTQPLMDEFAQETNNVKTAFDDIPPAVDEAVEAQKRKIESLKESVRLVEKEKSAVEAQKQAFENQLKVSDAKLNAEAAINQMQNKGLQIAYEMAGSAGERLKLAREIFKNEMQGAKIAFKQTLNSIKAEQQRLVFRKQAAVIEAKMIQAQGELAAAKERDGEKAALILEKTQKAVQVQRENIGLIDGQIASQSKIAGFQRQAAEAQLQSARMTAEQNLKQRLVSDGIKMSEEKAAQLTGRLGESSIESMNLEGSVRRVGDNARSTSHMFIQVSNNANNAANQITRAAIAQERLNRARVRQSSSRSSSTTRQAAEGAYWKGGFQAFARGGVVNGPTLGLVGEGGEPEYIIPQSKAAGFAANFLAGQRGAGAIPGFAEGGYVGPINISTGPVMQQDGTNYVTMAQFEAGIRDVTSSIAKSGRSYGSRRFTGIS